ncbi:hypothetical protein RLDS_12460 [Sphingobium lactosutens DS20]|uniref:Uncharacterized protein n=1 Tax=Sphingobium lactosutens DS20 TaxID=1331060 RepID=T0HF42_9SPHN|nr:hypothetical protein RLDS_12460 [Sphingobium lactosutens DS20]
MMKDIRRQTRRHCLAKDKIRVVLDGLRSENSITELYRKERIARSLTPPTLRFMEPEKRRLTGKAVLSVILCAWL